MNPGKTIPTAMGMAMTSPQRPKQNPTVKPRVVITKHYALVMLYLLEAINDTPNIPHPIGKANTKIKGAIIIDTKM